MMNNNNTPESVIEALTEERMKELYYDDLRLPSTSEAVTIACEDAFDIIGDLLSSDCPNKSLDLVKQLQDNVYEAYKKLNLDSVTRDLDDNMLGEDYDV